MRGSANTEDYGKKRLANYGRLCGWTLARSHARSGDPVAITGYMGSSGTFDAAVADFSVAYADQNESDYAAFKAAADAGKISVQPEEEAD
jgi:thiamine monophosphate kinase